MIFSRAKVLPRKLLISTKQEILVLTIHMSYYERRVDRINIFNWKVRVLKVIATAKRTADTAPTYLKRYFVSLRPRDKFHINAEGAKIWLILLFSSFISEIVLWLTGPSRSEILIDQKNLVWCDRLQNLEIA